MKSTLTLAALFFLGTAIPTLASTPELRLVTEAPDSFGPDVTITYPVPDFTEVITNSVANTRLYKRPLVTSPYRILADQGEGSYTQWSDEEREEETEYTDYLLEGWYAPVLAKQPNFISIPEENTIAYVLLSQTQSERIQYLSLDNLDEDPMTYVIKEGPYKDWIIYMSYGEGGITYNLGRLHGNIAVFPLSTYAYCDQDAEGLIYNPDEGIIFGPDYNDELAEYIDAIDLKRLTPDAFDIFFLSATQYYNSADTDTNYLFLYSVKGTLQCTYIASSLISRFSQQASIKL